jgi:DNA polymerase (family 10)
MKNAAIAKVFQDIADLLELKEENQFKIRAYQRAARSIENLPTPVEQLWREKKLKEVPGIGEAIEKKITEILTTGRLGYYDKLRAEFPQGISLLMDIPGIGPKTALKLSQELKISTIDELEKAIWDGRVAGLFRMGEKSAENILRRIQALRRKDQRVPLGQALPIVEGILSSLGACPGVQQLVAAGSTRRFKETVGDIDIMGTALEPEQVLQAFTELPQVEEVLLQGTTKSSVIVGDGLQVDLRIVEQDSFGSLLQYFTGSKEHNIALRERAVRQGLKLSEYGITTVKTGKVEKFATEEGYYHRQGLEFIPPELREGRDEIGRAENKMLPKLIELSDIKGDLHVHTEWSDGHDAIEAMALAAKARGYRYLAITDHSWGRGIARGLSEERLRRQMAEVKRISQSIEGLRLLSGIEVDIRADGSLDLPDEILSELDIVIAAVHSAMGQDEDKMTRRVLKAMENPYVDVLAHPTCRLLGEREPINIDLEQVFQAALCWGIALEINAQPDRLDLNDLHVFRAREMGVELIINTDAHSAAQLDLMRFGVGVARRGWCEAGHILNTKPVEEVEAFLRRH